MTRTLLACLLPPVFLSGIAGADWYESAPVNYSKSEAHTPLTELQAGIESGAIPFDPANDREALRQILEHLEIPVESQVLVYSKTSFQISLIFPKRPRAIYFGDNAYVGWVPGGMIEVTTFDPELGTIFHVVRPPGHDHDRKLKIARDRTCLQCHGDAGSNGVPGVMVRSVFPSVSGHPLTRAGSFLTTHASPMEERWGGWYVTGNTGGAGHMGNAVYEENEDGEFDLKKLTAEPTLELSEVIDGESYLAGPHSDIAALMVLEHQVTVHNALVHGNLTTRRMLHLDRALKSISDDAEDDGLGEIYLHAIESEADKIVRALLFADEVELDGDGIQGRDSFLTAFQRGAPTDAKGHSLKDLRLYRRLFKYRCSYLIYSDPFTHLPEPLKGMVISRLHSILTQPEKHPDYEYLRERASINEILSATLPGWPAS